MLAEINADFESESLYIPLYYYRISSPSAAASRAVAFKYGEIIDFAGLEVAE